ncbi:MAG: K(+)-transporting ATPase subunit F, partial [Acidobacteriaceae bacterium]|nr:K(+)-transporting ATPase subunit F [Acidobacteriaceae bacterium]
LFAYLIYALLRPEKF